MNVTKSIEPVFNPGASFKAIDLEYGSPRDTLPCSVEWCIGHTTRQAGTWDDLTHQASTVDLLLPGPQVQAEVVPLLGPDGIAYYVYFNVEGGMSSAEALNLAENLRIAAARLERAIRRHPELVKAGQIGGDR